MLKLAFSLPPPDPGSRRLATAWLMLALGSLVVAGLYTLLIVLSRTPGVQDIFPWVDFFHIALVVHVDLTVVVWFLSFAGVLWSLNSSTTCQACGWIALYLCVGGALVISLAPFLGAADPLMNNYVPVLRDPIFFAGLGLFGLGFGLLVFRGLFFSQAVGQYIRSGAALRFGLYTALVIGLLSLLAVFASWLKMPEFAQDTTYYELLFWGGGHTIQFMHVQLMLVAWLWLANASGARLRLNPRVALLLFALGALPAIFGIYIYWAFEVGSANHLLGFTWQMQFGGGLAALPFALIILLAVILSGRANSGVRAERSALWFSILLFGAGGVIGFLIDGSNVTVPAHYHGSIVAVTLAFMGLTYHLLPMLGFRKPVGRSVRLQPIIFGVGQLLHVLGLALSGNRGVQRKVAGPSQGLDNIQELAGMAIMGLGGLIAIIGGIMFLVIVFRAMWPQKPELSAS